MKRYTKCNEKSSKKNFFTIKIIKPIEDSRIIIAFSKFPKAKKISVSDEKGNYSIFRVADKIEIYTESSKMSDFKYRVVIALEDSNLVLYPKFEVDKDGNTYSIYPQYSKNIITNVLEYAYHVFIRELAPYIPRKSRVIVRKKGIQHVRSHSVTDYYRADGTYVSAGFKQAYTREIK